nr:probable RNA methyltransferase CG11342 [Onthophagus taurus]
MNVDELNFKGNDPGAVKHGNFINYYQFHPPNSRINLLPSDAWKSFDEMVCLDVGCNAGDLTIALHKYFTELHKTIKILGVDLDPILIKRAQVNNKNENITFTHLDFTNDSERIEILKNYLKDKNKFDVTFCFSITMWIHLNNGDEGLIHFIKSICEISKMIVIEPQPWKCYKTAIRRMKKSNETFPRYEKLQIRHQVEEKIEETLLQLNFIKINEIFEPKWGRKLQIFSQA